MIHASPFLKTDRHCLRVKNNKNNFQPRKSCVPSPLKNRLRYCQFNSQWILMPYVHVNGFQGESLKVNIQWYIAGWPLKYFKAFLISSNREPSTDLKYCSHKDGCLLEGVRVTQSRGGLDIFLYWFCSSWSLKSHKQNGNKKEVFLVTLLFKVREEGVGCLFEGWGTCLTLWPRAWALIQGNIVFQFLK